jgi:hypothetical protein
LSSLDWICCHHPHVLVQIREDTLPWPGQEHGATGNSVCLEQTVDGEKAIDSGDAGMSAPDARAKTPELAKVNEIEGKAIQKNVAILPSLSSGALLPFNACLGAGYADLPKGPCNYLQSLGLFCKYPYQSQQPVIFLRKKRSSS